MKHSNLETIAKARTFASKALQAISSSPTLDADILLSLASTHSRVTLLAHPEYSLSESQQNLFLSMLKKRLQGIPIAYIRGEQAFWSLDLIVSEDTLIPRPETELLVSLTLETLADKNTCNILELGTGSGAIAIALAHTRDDWHILASDISEPALYIAQQNIAKHHIENITLKQSNWYQQIPAQSFHAIISNPPYISRLDPDVEESVVKFEPEQALFSKDNGLADSKIIIQKAPAFLEKDGWLFLEHGHQQNKAMEQFFKAAGFTSVNSVKDLSGKARVTFGQR